jgi:hypothetical protein
MDIVNSCSRYGGKVVLDYAEYLYGASQIPDEDEKVQFPVRYGVICDPNGYFVEVLDDPAVYAEGKVRLNVLDLKESREFYENVLGMKTLRYRSNINSRPRHPSLVSFMVRSFILSFQRLILKLSGLRKRNRRAYFRTSI